MGKLRYARGLSDLKCRTFYYGCKFVHWDHLSAKKKCPKNNCFLVI